MRPALLAITLLLVACAPEPRAASPSLPPSSAPSPGASSASSPASSPLAANACATVSECTSCASQPSCRWCTEPRGCTSAGASCAGLLLGHPGTCDNDPVERARLMTQREEARARGLTAEGPPVVGHLETFPGVDFSIARGRCYAAIVRFGAGARLGDVSQNERMLTREESAGGSSLAQPSTPGAPSNLYCPRSPGKLAVWYEDRWSRARVTSAGHGEISVQLYSMPISEADLRAGDAKSAAIDAKIDRMPAGCDDCDYDCRASGTACERRCFVDTAGGARAGKSACEYGCQQITRACQDQCEVRCR